MDKFKDLLDKVESMTVIELNEFVKAIEERFGVSAGAVAVSAGAGAGAAAARSRPQAGGSVWSGACWRWSRRSAAHPR